LALDAIDFTCLDDYKTKYIAELNKSTEIVSCKYFTTNILEFDRPIEKDYNNLDSFVIYITLEGNFEVEAEEGTEKVSKGETVLIPASIEFLKLNPQNGKVKLLEVFVP
jgi:mannose-6-phosphate isomerase